MTKCATTLVAVGIGLIWMTACGGRSQNGGSGAAGASSSAGAAGVGNGGSTSNAGAAGASACALPKLTGPCDAYNPSFWHNPKTGLCEPFVYGGCEGNANRFATREACIAQCGSTTGDDWGSCENDGDCSLVSNGCCAACEPVRDEQLLAVNAKHVVDQQNSICPGGAACAPCASATEYEGTLKYFKPVCTAHRCSLLDVRQSPLTECKTDADCTLRDGVNCCAGCDGSGYVPVNASADFCDGAPTPCPACVSIGANQYRAQCKSGACAFSPPLR
ncbi:MAG: BPTI/Kunitz domain-containing protein [Pseudomonadota bacterium]